MKGIEAYPNLQPLGDRVIIKMPEKGDKTTASGIILSDSTTKGTAVFGEVMMVGPGIYTQLGNLIPMTVKVGDNVMYKKDMGGDPLKIGGVEYLLFREQDLLLADFK
jgi:chaperonin GroES